MKKNSRKKILSAALDIFGQKGYKAATIREICKKAGVNIALVNYHFTCKKSLYQELFDTIMHEVMTNYPVSGFIKPEMTRDEKLKGFVTLLVKRSFGEGGMGKNKLRLQLITREMMEPTEVMKDTILVRVHEIREAGIAVMKEYLPEYDDNRLMMFVVSIISQCMHPMFAAEVLKMSGFPYDGSDEFNEKLIEHIYSFSRCRLLAGAGGD